MVPVYVLNSFVRAIKRQKVCENSIIAALVAVAAAGRLEHLERSYLPPDNSISAARSSFGSNGGFGSPSSHGSFGGNSFGAAGAGLQSRNAGSAFAGATSNQYLPPDHGPSGSNGAPQFGGSHQGFGAQNFRSQQYSGRQASHAQQYSSPVSQYSAPQGPSSFGAPSYQAQYPQQSGAASRQYLAPRTGSYQNPPQQAFDEQTGYHY